MKKRTHDILTPGTLTPQMTARFSLLRLISVQLSAAGFTHVQDQSLLEDIEGLLDGLMEGLVRLAYELSQHTRRSRPNVRDMLAACADQGIEIGHLLATLSQTLPHAYGMRFELPIAPAIKTQDPTAGFLSSDSESEHDQEQPQTASQLNVSSNVRKNLNPEMIGSLPHLPALPAKHTWRQTYVKPAPVTVLPPPHASRPGPATATSQSGAISLAANPSLFPSEASSANPNIPACLSSLDRRIADTRLVEASLLNLVADSAPDTRPPLSQPARRVDPTGLSFGELLVRKNAAGIQIPIVNYESSWYGSKAERNKRYKSELTS